MDQHGNVIEHGVQRSRHFTEFILAHHLGSGIEVTNAQFTEQIHDTVYLSGQTACNCPGQQQTKQQGQDTDAKHHIQHCFGDLVQPPGKLVLVGKGVVAHGSQNRGYLGGNLFIGCKLPVDIFISFD